MMFRKVVLKPGDCLVIRRFGPAPPTQNGISAATGG